MERIVKGLVEIRKGLDQNLIEVEGERYNVLTQDEINRRFDQFQENLWDDLGFEAFTESAQEYIINNFVETEYFEQLEFEVLMERLEYVDEQEMLEIVELYGAKTLDECAEQYVLDNMSGDSINWFVNEFDSWDGLLYVVRENNLLDFASVIDYVKDVDGYEILASVDGVIEEYFDSQTNEWYYIYLD